MNELFFEVPKYFSYPNTAKIQFGKLFIGGIQTNVTERDIKEYFERFGQVSKCTIHRNIITGRSRGFGFITFYDPSAVDKVQETRPHMIGGYEVTLKRAVPQKLLEEYDGLRTVNRIFVGGLRQEVEESDLRDYFGKFGNVRKIEILIDKCTNLKRGFAFIEFDDYDPVDKAVMQGTHTILGQQVTVKKAKSRLEMELMKRKCFSTDTLPPFMRRRSVPFENETYRSPFAAAFNSSSFGSIGYMCPLHFDTRRRRFF